MSPRFDIIVHGATGFTGRLVCRMLLSDPDSAVGAPNALKWAIAGRSEKKLQETKEKLKKFPEVDAAAIDAVPIVVADSMNEAQITDMVKQTKVVLSLVGPYKLYGEALIKACTENGVHYCDLTGEVIWVREMINKYQATAEKSGAKIVNCCGMDSIPQDLSTFMLADSVRKTRNSSTSKINLFLTKFVGAFGGGTIASMLTQHETSSPAQFKAMANPFNLTDQTTIVEKQRRCLITPNSEAASLMLTKEPELNKWSSKLTMVLGDQSIVHRSNYLLGGKYGNSFVYRERNASKSFFQLLLGTLISLITDVMFAFASTRAILAKRAPKPGEGPSEEALQNGSVRLEAFAYDDNNKLAARLQMTGVGDPGLILTAKMIAESAKCLANGESNEQAMKGGFWTPAAAFGYHLRDRLEAKHIFKIDLDELQ